MRNANEYLLHLQGLRALAVVLVMLAHAGVPGLAGGFIGVDVFFVLSGYLISRMLIREKDRTGRIALGAFYARRLRRLLPALLCMIALTAPVAHALLSRWESWAMLASLPYALSWTSNLYFAFRSVDYFDELSAGDLFMHTWSLGVEEQFYLLWPLMILALPFGRALGEHARRHRRITIFVAITLTALAIAAVWARLVPMAAYFLTPTRIWQFALGALVFMLRDGTPTLPTPIARSAVFAGLAAILATALMLGPETSHSGLNALCASLGAALVIAAGESLAASGRRQLLDDARLVWLGDRSYSLYLWHWPVLTLATALEFERSAIGTGAALLLCMLLAMLSYQLVELPFWKGRFSRLRPGRSFAVGAGTALLVFAGSLQALKPPPAGTPFLIEPLNNLKLGLPAIYDMDCDGWIEHARVEPCDFGPEDAPRTMVLLGDSIGAQWFSAYHNLFPAPDWRIRVLTKSGCPIVDQDIYYDRIGGSYEVCSRWRDDAIDTIAAWRPDLVLIGSSSYGALDRSAWVDGSRRILERLAPTTARIVLVAGTPRLDFHGPTCVTRRMEAGQRDYVEHCRSERRADAADRVAEYLREATGNFPNAAVADFAEIVCPNRVCATISPDGITVFRDRQHINDGFARARTERIGQALADLSVRP